MRQVVLARQRTRSACRSWSRTWTRIDLSKADEVFVTNAVVGIRPVAERDRRASLADRRGHALVDGLHRVTPAHDASARRRGRRARGVVALAAGWLRVVERWLDAPHDARVRSRRGSRFPPASRSQSPRGTSRGAACSTIRGCFAAYARLTRRRCAGARRRVRDAARARRPRQLLALLESGAVVQHSVTIVEGWTFRDLRQRARARARRSDNDAGRAGRRGGHERARRAGARARGPVLSRHLPVRQGHHGPRRSCARRASACARNCDAAWASRAETCRFAAEYEALILASIVEKETAHPAERARIAGVFTERLRAGHAPADRPDRDLRARRGLRRQPASRRTSSATGRTIPTRARGCRRRRSRCRARRRSRRRCGPTSAANCTSSRPALPDGSHQFSRTLAEHEQAVATVPAAIPATDRRGTECAGRFITFEGGEGVGKSTQIARARRLAARAAASKSC